MTLPDTWTSPQLTSRTPTRPSTRPRPRRRPRRRCCRRRYPRRRRPPGCAAIVGTPKMIPGRGRATVQARRPVRRRRPSARRRRGQVEHVVVVDAHVADVAAHLGEDALPAVAHGVQLDQHAGQRGLHGDAGAAEAGDPVADHLTVAAGLPRRRVGQHHAVGCRPARWAAVTWLSATTASPLTTMPCPVRRRPPGCAARAGRRGGRRTRRAPDRPVWTVRVERPGRGDAEVGRRRPRCCRRWSARRGTRRCRRG